MGTMLTQTLWRTYRVGQSHRGTLSSSVFPRVHREASRGIEHIFTIKLKEHPQVSPME